MTTDPTVTHQLDQYAAGVTQARGPGGYHPLREFEQGLLRELLGMFRDVTPQQLGGILLAAGVHVSRLVQRMSPESRANAGVVLGNLLQLAGERAYTGQLPVDHVCQFTLVGGKLCRQEFHAPDQAALDIQVRGHIELHHPHNRKERRA